MGTERLYRIEGIVMGRRNQGEADRVLTLCTPRGKVNVLAKGARKPRSRKAGHIELFCHSSFVVSRVKNYWDIVSQAETVEPHAVLRSDLLRGTYGRYAVELLDRFFTEGEGGQALFDLLNHTLVWLCEDDDLDLVARFYEQHLLGLAGFRPELFRCVGKHDEHTALRPLETVPREDKRAYGFDPEHGGALCQDCYSERQRLPAVVPLSPRELAFLQECQRGPYTRIRNRQTSQAVHQEVERAMQHYVTYHLEQGIKSGTFLRRLREESNL